MNQFKKNRIQYTFLMCSLLLLIFNFINGEISGVFSDEFIYFHKGHLNADFLDFLIYDPKLFFGHPPLVSFTHWLLSPLGMDGLRLFHVIALWGVIILFSPRSLWQYLCCFFILIQPTILTHSTLIYPEIIQGLLGILIFRLFEKEKFNWCGAIFFVALLWRESSLAFFVALAPLIVTQKDFKLVKCFLPGLIFLCFHLTYVALTKNWNPGRLEAQSSLMSFSEVFSHLNQIGSFLLGVFLFYVFFQWPLFYGLKKKVNLSLSLLRKMEVTLLIAFVSLISFLIFNKPVADSWDFFFRVRSLGLLGVALFLALGFFTTPKKLERSFFYTFLSCAFFYGFFFFYRDISTRDLIPCALLALFGLSRVNPSRTLVVLMLASINLSLAFHFAGKNNSLFFNGSSAGLNSLQRDYYLGHFNKSLEEMKDREIQMDLGVGSVVSSSFFVEHVLKESSQKQSDFLSFDSHLQWPIIEKNIAFTLYSRE